MSKRLYNVFFHTHTVSGIVISAVLFVLFFCGAFALIKDEITAWEKGEPIDLEQAYDVDYERAIATMEQEGYDLYGRDIRMLLPDAKQQLYVLLSPSQDSTVVYKPGQKSYFFINTLTYEKSEYYGFYSIGELIYRLHFFSQIPTIGIYIAGFVAFFFLFAIVTGVIVHWKKIISNFYVFRPKVKLKTVWTDAHTALGMIGLPFQFIFALTSCFLCLSALVLIPANYLYSGDQAKLLTDLRPMTQTYQLEGKTDKPLLINQFIDQTQAKWPGFEPLQVYIKNYGAENMKFQIDGKANSKDKFMGTGRIVYEVSSGAIFSEKNPFETSYLESVEHTVRSLHFGDFGGFPLKILYFILALVTCFVIISGVLIWLEARNKKVIPIHQRLFNRKVGHIYIAICLSLYPIIAFSFIVAKALPRSLDPERQSILYAVFFIGWLLATLYFRFKRDNYFTTLWSLRLAAYLGLIIPVVNGLISGNWLWISYSNNAFPILIIDLFWLAMAAMTFVVLKKLKRPVEKVEHKQLLQELVTFYRQEYPELIHNNSNLKTIENMKSKIAFLWLFIAIGYIIHHIYGLFSVYYYESVMMEGATGIVPVDHHLWRIGLEGASMLFCLFTLEIKAAWFRVTSIFWAVILGLFNAYHVVTAILHEASNFSEILILGLMLVANILLVKTLLTWKKEGMINTVSE